jgi:tetratricopeptide (TPR) repeat protein
MPSQYFTPAAAIQENQKGEQSAASWKFLPHHTGKKGCPKWSLIRGPIQRTIGIGTTTEGQIMRVKVILAATFGLCLMKAGPVLADGGGSDRSSNTPTCGNGEVWDTRSQKCVKAENGVLPDQELTDYAFALVKTGRYSEALAVLDLLSDPNTPVALNYRGYATRKLGRIDEGISYYLKSIARDPRYAQVREYLGEAYLVKGDMAGANVQLQAIKQICGTVCEEYEHLAVAIADPTNL